ncbi:hypothetical protein VNO77_43398 [Canavalia gladiata]|uniref:Uncharacterized protein n=1 Tax=Canavalia gladiata TaxID=3824 RepID=A0AAN9PPW7_CANGL
MASVYADSSISLVVCGNKKRGFVGTCACIDWLPLFLSAPPCSLSSITFSVLFIWKYYLVSGLDIDHSGTCLAMNLLSIISESGNKTF